MQRLRSAFSTTEVVVVLSLAALLVVVVVQVVAAEVEDGRREIAEQDLRALERAFLAFERDTGEWPALSGGAWDRGILREDLVAEDHPLLLDRYGLDGWRGPYLDLERFERGLVDPWGARYVVHGWPAGVYSESPFGALVIATAGADGWLATGELGLMLGEAEDDDLVVVVTSKP